MGANEFTTGPLTLDEMMKILSLLENPEDAKSVRQALRFYAMPEQDSYSWAPLESIMRDLKLRSCPQRKEDIEKLLPLVAGSKAVLEIGSGFGGMTKQLASVMPRGCTYVAVEKNLTEPAYLNPNASLREVCRQLSILGANVELILGDSHAPSTVERISHYAPFDFVFVGTGDKVDFEHYSQMGRMTGIVGSMIDEIAATGAHVERFGNIGVVYRE